MVQRGPRRRGVVLVERGQLADALGQRRQLLDGLRARLERGAARLVGERHGHVDVHHPRQRLDRVALQCGQLVEAVEERLRAPPTRRGGPERIQRVPGVQLAVDAPAAIELADVLEVDRAEIFGVRGAPLVRRGPAAQRRDEPLRRHQRSLKLGDQLRGRGAEARRTARLRERSES